MKRRAIRLKSGMVVNIYNYFVGYLPSLHTTAQHCIALHVKPLNMHALIVKVLASSTSIYVCVLDQNTATYTLLLDGKKDEICRRITQNSVYIHNNSVNFELLSFVANISSQRDIRFGS